mmetsp:Transcript_23456/g.34599  ORF Transcript_23456/g.34599 Transcript_23456/m.34599 type:complete len:562 (-) Transcript_23456:58-1743(-)
MAVVKDIMDQQVADLRERMRLLQQDRRANVDLLEASRSANAEEVRSLREENKELRTRLTQLQKGFGSKRGGGHELANLQREVLNKRTEYDTLKVLTEKHKNQLNKLKDEAKTCELEAKRPSQEDSPLSRQIRMLENRLDKAMIKYNEAQSIRNTYEHIVKRLKEERVSFDNQLTALERTLKSKQRDYDEILLLAGDASHARELAQQELHRSRCGYEEKRTRREGEIRERHQIVKIRKQMLERQERREMKRKQVIDGQLVNDSVDSVGEAAARSSVLSAGIGGGVSGIEDMEVTEELETKLDIYESAFRKIKEATGVSDVNEVIQKIIGQESTTENLVSLTKQNQGKIEDLATTRDKLKRKVDEIKYSCSGSYHSKNMVDEKEDKLNSSTSHLDRSKGKLERLATILISVKAGIKHLQDKVDIIREEFKTDKIILDDSSIIDVLRTTGDVLVELDARMKENEISELAFSSSETIPTQSLRSSFDMMEALDGLDEEEVQENRPFNQRILLPSVRDDIFDSCSDYEDGFGDVDEDELSRDKVKKASSQIIQAQERKRTRDHRRS